MRLLAPFEAGSQWSIARLSSSPVDRNHRPQDIVADILCQILDVPIHKRCLRTARMRILVIGLAMQNHFLLSHPVATSNGLRASPKPP